MKKVLITLSFVLVTSFIFSQDYRLGKVSKEELQEKYYPLDSSANAAVLYKKSKTYYTYNEQLGWTLITEVHERIKIYNKEGYDWATKKITLYAEDEQEKVTIKAYTYNLEKGKIEKIKLKNGDIFSENMNKYWNATKFTMPNLTEGCVVEWEYTIRSPYYWHIDEIQIQYKIPVKFIEVQVTTPDFFVFKNQTKGYIPFNINKTQKQSSMVFLNKRRESNGYVEKTSFNQEKVTYVSNVLEFQLNDVPAIIEEPYVNNIDNYTSSLKFELTAYTPKYDTHKYYNTTWEDVTKTIYKSSDFGKELEITSHFKDDLASLVATEAPSAEKIGKIFQFVKSKIKWNGYHSKYTSDGVRKAYKEGVGNVAEINLTLVAMLREAGIKANPILVSTRDNGIPIFPTTDGFNYVISGVEIGDQIVMLDATEQYSLPNVLPLRDINWQGRIVREDGTSDWVDLTTNNPSVKNSIMKIDINDEGEIEGMNRVQYSNLEALKYRNKNAKIKEEDIIIKAEEENGGIEISEFKVDNKTDLDKSVIEVYKFSSEELTDVMGGKIYFKPLLFNALEENPFKLEKREYPIDFGTPLVSKNMLSITIPEGFSVESLPENLAIGLPNKYGVYKFDISVNGNKIDIYSILQINTPVYPIQFYSEIKEFYKQIVNKNVEQIVLKKV